ncbi:MAG: nucleotidyltransferase family protein [Butyricicoccus sp.]
MSVCGIIAEYNPFHAGHARHCAAIRESLPGCSIVAAMSGNYVQRGDLAIWEKYRRAAFAVQSGGPDLVLELPLSAALSSAERFASGGAALLHATGLLTHLSFGSECGDVRRLQQAAAILDSDAFAQCRAEQLKRGLGYAAASEQAMEHLCPDCAPLLRSPNDTLGIQYIRALSGTDVSILPVLRRGAGHDRPPEGGYPSASWLRRQMTQGADVRAYLPEYTRTWPQHVLHHYERDILSYLRRLSAEQWMGIADVSEGLEHRLYRVTRDQPTWDGCIDELSSKRYPRSRMRRILLCGYLGITKELAALPPQYLRVLAFNERGRQLLRNMKQTTALPIITKPLAAQSLTGSAARLWELDMLADDVYHFPAPSGSGWKQTPRYFS